jgi:soluble lytic murein transglycosylase-like protein
MRVESDMRPSAHSPKGAIGLMQVMPGVFESLDLPGAIAHLETNIEAGCLVLADNIRRRGEQDGISSYFWGNRIRGHEYLQRVESALDELAVEAEAVRSRS